MKSIDKGIVLYVDDEPKNLTSFKAIFRRHYKIFVAESAQEGIEIMNNNPVHIVITDQRMPNMTGVEFLEKISAKYPEVTRIILTGYSDAEAIIGAINQGKVFKYMTKPWKKDELQVTIDTAIEAYQLKKDNYQLIENLRKANQELDNFVYRASHDLRAPVTTLMGLIGVIRTETDLQKVHELLQMQDTTLQKLDSFIQDLTHYVRNKKLELVKADIDFKKVVEGVLGFYQFYMNSNKIEKIIKVEQEQKFYTDVTRLEVILNNLITNAIRFNTLSNENPYLKIEVKVDQKQATIKVQDNGAGIREEHLSKIFDMFFKTKESSQGTGLGLFLVKEAVSKLNGKIVVKSEFKKGTIFEVKIPSL